jgi:hypothetical protein
VSRVVLTADTITDEQIRAGYQAGLVSYSLPSRHWPPSNGDCGTRYEARCSCGWMQGASSREHADAIARGHVEEPDLPVIVCSAVIERNQKSKP